ncbi:MAG: hypothetical protein C0515_08120 [Novosphingobium sp.]|nr:hypothetical protein [Novosphingobium sp.]
MAAAKARESPGQALFFHIWKGISEQAGCGAFNRHSLPGPQCAQVLPNRHYRAYGEVEEQVPHGRAFRLLSRLR